MSNKSNEHKQSGFSIKARLRSFSYAWQGIKLLIGTEHNAWIHCFITVVVIGMGFFFGINRYEWMMIAGCIGLVFAAEAINTAIEQLVNLVSPQYHPIAKKVKDLAAAAVLICAIAAVVIGTLIFYPYIF